MKPLSKAEGLQLIRDVTNHAWEHLAFFDKKTIDNIDDMRISRIQYLRQEYVKRIRRLENDLHQLVKPQMQNIMFTLIKDKCYDWFPDDTRQKLVRDYNDQLFCDLKQNEV